MMKCPSNICTGQRDLESILTCQLLRGPFLVLGMGAKTWEWRMEERGREVKLNRQMQLDHMHNIQREKLDASVPAPNLMIQTPWQLLLTDQQDGSRSHFQSHFQCVG